MLVLAANPSEFYFKNRILEEWMIYRFAVCYLLGSFCLLLLLAVALANHMAFFSPRRSEANTFWASVITSLLRGPGLIAIVVFLMIFALFFLWPGITEYLSKGTVHLHWSRLLAGSFSIYSMLQIGVFYVLIRVVEIWRYQQDFKTCFNKEA